MLKIGSKAPAFKAFAEDGKEVSSTQLKSQPFILYFYPKDDTPGCTKEACGFRDNLPHFKKSKAAIFGVSKDSIKSHQKFKEKYELTFPLLSDEDGKMCEAYGVWQEKTMMGKKYMGIVRTTFLIDKDGKIAHIWNNVKVDGHVEEVMEALKQL